LVAESRTGCIEEAQPSFFFKRCFDVSTNLFSAFLVSKQH